MKHKLDFQPIWLTVLFALTISYVLCVMAGVLFNWTMYQTWMPLLPGFKWPLTATGFLIGVVWIVGYSIYVAALLVFPYNYLTRD